MDATIEPLLTAHYGVAIDHAARVGVGVAAVENSPALPYLLSLLEE